MLVKISLTPQETELVLQVIAKQPIEVAGGVFGKIQTQAQAQIAAAEEAAVGQRIKEKERMQHGEPGGAGKEEV